MAGVAVLAVLLLLRVASSSAGDADADAWASNAVVDADADAWADSTAVVDADADAWASNAVVDADADAWASNAVVDADIGPDAAPLNATALTPAWGERASPALVKGARYLAFHAVLVGVLKGWALAMDAVFSVLGVDYGGTPSDLFLTMMKVLPWARSLLAPRGLGGSHFSPSGMAAWALDSLKALGGQVALTGGVALAYYGGPAAINATLRGMASAMEE